MKYCGQIERVQLPQSITKISTESFKECIKLKEININQNKMKNEHFKCVKILNMMNNLN
ncbi:hypothetical protein ENUP19_0093G0009 [Entamoeba nuttalli]|uniref:Leucine rich repeat protein, BspA family protein n=1 Tax=Entamoeba nuttalli TaxID=412467 RepID=A0ABQ0DGW2_9EUKA